MCQLVLFLSIFVRLCGYFVAGVHPICFVGLLSLVVCSSCFPASFWWGMSSSLGRWWWRRCPPSCWWSWSWRSCWCRTLPCCCRGRVFCCRTCWLSRCCSFWWWRWISCWRGRSCWAYYHPSSFGCCSWTSRPARSPWCGRAGLYVWWICRGAAFSVLNSNN